MNKQQCANNHVIGSSILCRSLPRKDLQILVGHGCPSMDAKAVFSAKLIRKLVHLDEGDVSRIF
jgi:hypothetical protein